MFGHDVSQVHVVEKPRGACGGYPHVAEPVVKDFGGGVGFLVHTVAWFVLECVRQFLAIAAADDRSFWTIAMV